MFLVYRMRHKGGGNFHAIARFCAWIGALKDQVLIVRHWARVQFAKSGQS